MAVDREKQLKRQNEWIKNNVARYNLTLKKDMDERIKAAAKEVNESTPEYIRKAVEMRLDPIIDMELYAKLDKLTDGKAKEKLNIALQRYLAKLENEH